MKVYNLYNQKDRNEYAKSDAEKSLKGRQYGYRSSAKRAIKNQKKKYGTLFVEKQRYGINQLDDGCFEII